MVLTHDYRFLSALPIWEEGTNKVMNRTVCFRAELPCLKEKTVLAAAASCSFILQVNGVFVAHGPARTAHGYFRVDEYDITPYLTAEKNIICLRVAGYNINSFSYLNQPSFLCSEITADGKILAATGERGFTAFGVDERIMKVQRYSFQRTFTESYSLKEGAFDYEMNICTKALPLKTEVVSAGYFICRDVPYSENEPLYPVSTIQKGTVTYSDKKSYYAGREISNINDLFLGYKPEELECSSNIEIGKINYAVPVPYKEQARELSISKDSYLDLDMGRNDTGILSFDLQAEKEGELYLTFDEILINGQLNCFRMSCSNIMVWKVQKGVYHVITAEPYVMQYIRLTAKGADFKIKNLKLYHIAFPMSEIKRTFAGDDKQMEKIYDAALETFRANVVDIYMDCPSRERAGWLCDSFFTSSTEYVMTGKSLVERAFLENFLLPERFPHLPDNGMLPACYPSDHNNKMFIPNWAMWYGLELEKYFKHTHDQKLIDVATKRLHRLVEYFRSFENEFGLLEKLESWVFVDWSKSNELCQDVSFPSNMLYAAFLSAIGNLYNDQEALEKAAKLRKTIHELSMTESGFYCDNAIRKNGKLVLSGERTETCQYYAFFCKIATPEKNKKLWDILVHDFGYDRQEKGLYPEIYPAAAFIGNYLRLDLLCQYGYKEALYDNIKGYFTYMAEKTGTLWEHTNDKASCNHGFASYVLYWMDQLNLLK
ncbi:MAG: hypothetical protein WCS73_04520 [Lentisphaeria bacterium]